MSPYHDLIRRFRLVPSRARLHAPSRSTMPSQEQVLIGLTALLFVYILLHFIVPLWAIGQ